VLKQLVELYPDKVEREVVTDLTGYKTSTRNAYLARLRAKQLVVVVDREHVKASETLFEVDA
jgi:hypothetical protein